MFTRPEGVFQKIYSVHGIDEIPIQPDRWKYFNDEGSAKALATEMGALPGVSGLTVSIDPECVLAYDVTNPGNLVNMWNIAGTYAPNGTGPDVPQYPISENAGWLADRRTKPNPFVDVDRGPGADPTFPVGGPNLHIDLLSGVAQFRWGK